METIKERLRKVKDDEKYFMINLKAIKSEAGKELEPILFQDVGVGKNGSDEISTDWMFNFQAVFGKKVYPHRQSAMIKIGVLISGNRGVPEI